MIGIYFSGTGNTKYCIEKFISHIADSVSLFPLEQSIQEKVPSEIILEIQKTDTIIFAYPIYYSNLPKIVRDFIDQNKEIWHGKRIYIIATFGLFSGDGAGLSARLFKKYGAEILGGLHLKMPDCICDVKLLKHSNDKNKDIVKRANKKIEDAAKLFLDKIPHSEGLSIWYRLVGLFGQRLWFFNKTKVYSDKIKIDQNACIGCGKCVEVCPMKNLSMQNMQINSLSIENSKAVASNNCTMCYRCVNQCPARAITLLGDQVLFQQKVEDYL